MTKDQQPSEADVECVARIIDPDAWRIADEGGRYGLEKALDYSVERARAAIAALHSTSEGRVEQMRDIMADLECALVLTSEHAPTATVCSFVESSTQFKRLADFLRSRQSKAGDTQDV